MKTEDQTADTKTAKTGVIDKLKAYRGKHEGNENHTMSKTGIDVTYPAFRNHGVWQHAMRMAKNDIGKAQVVYVCKICLFDGERLTQADFSTYVPMEDSSELLAEIFGGDDEDDDAPGKRP